jgi:perosamine synthetase
MSEMSDISPIPLSVPHLAGNEWAYIKECLDTNWVSYVGPFVDRFERELAAKTGAKHAVATSSGTAALHVALLMAGVGPDDEVVMPAITFAAPANAVRYCGAWPVFVDIRAQDWQLDVEQAREFLEKGCESRNGALFNRATGRRVAALMPVHLLGGMCDVDAAAELASRFGLPLIEDAAECIGASFKGRGIGAPCAAYRGPLRIVITSFNGNKIITTGGGGAMFTDDPAVAARAKHLTTTAKADKIEFYHDEVGYNYRLTNIAAALGVAQLEKLDEYVEIKRGIAARYAEGLKGCAGVTVQPEPRDCRSIFWMYSVTLAAGSRPVMRRLNEQGIMARPIWAPMHRLPAFSGHCHVVKAVEAERFYEQGLSLPCSVGLTEADQRRVIAAVREEINPKR